MTIKIIDLTTSNTFNPDQLLLEGYKGVIFKGGQGQWEYLTRYQPTWWDMAKSAGLLRGRYWVIDSRYPEPGHIDEMKRFHVFDDLGELGLWADVEKPIITMTDADYWKTPYAGYKQTVSFVRDVRALGYNTGIYTSPGAYNLILSGAPQEEKDYLATCDLWTANYPATYVEGVSKPTLYGMWVTWKLWQYREGPDINIFNGTYEEFYLWINETDNGDEMPTTNYAFEVVTVNTAAGAYVNIRADHAYTSDDIGNFYSGDKAYGNETFTDANGDIWAHILETNAQGLKNGWVAVKYQGKAYTALTMLTPPPTQGLPDIDMSFRAVGYPDLDVSWKPL